MLVRSFPVLLALTACGAPIALDAPRADGAWSALTFSATSAPFAAAQTYLNAAGDFDGDGDPDILQIGTANEAFVWLNDGTGLAWTEAPQVLTATLACELVAADLNGDAITDFLTCGCLATKVYLGAGGGSFSGPTLVGGTVNGCDVGDVDGDGDGDMVGSDGRVWVNDGAGTFTAGQNLSLANVNDVCVDDVDADGDADLVTIASGGVGVWFNAGGALSNSGQSVAPSAGGAPRFCSGADIDGDGDWDVVLGAGTTNGAWGSGIGSVMKNDGHGVFTRTGSADNAREVGSDDFADFDGDGDIDFFSTASPTLHLNDGSGTFSTGPLSASNNNVAVLDANGDGFPDAFISRNSAPYSVLYLNVVPDTDGDGVYDPFDACPSEDPGAYDADADGCLDDADLDGVADPIDLCPDVADAGQGDLDGDGLGDACDDDRDDDGVANVDDDCPDAGNPTQRDRDGDQLGDACDDDRDGDGFANGVDDCPDHHDPDQADLDGDGVGDACALDFDGDGWKDAADNCAEVPNPAQRDLDRDGLGDACDDDRDGDGVANVADDCPDAPNPGQADRDGDGEGDVCDDDPIARFVGSCPGVMTLQALQFAPRARLTLVAALAPGSSPVPSGACPGVPTGLSSVEWRKIGVFRADGQGRLSEAVSVPGVACGGGRVYQLIDDAACAMSGVFAP